MTILPSFRPTPQHHLLLSYGRHQDVARWMCGVDELLKPSGVVVCRAHTGPDTIQRVEQGGLAAAVVCADHAQIDGLSLLRIIRSIDVELPCWLVTKTATRPTLQAALSLRVISVITHPDKVDALTLALRKVLVNRVEGN